MEQIEVRDVDLMEFENLLTDYYEYLQTIKEEDEWNELSRQAQLFRLENAIDLLNDKLGEIYDCNN